MASPIYSVDSMSGIIQSISRPLKIKALRTYKVYIFIIHGGIYPDHFFFTTKNRTKYAEKRLINIIHIYL